MILTSIDLSSPVFYHDDFIPSTYTCEGQDINPPLVISGIPAETKSLALIVDDPDAPFGTWDHWLVWNINPSTRKIAEGETPQGALQGTNSFKKLSYGGPCPPFGTHRYFFRVYALDIALNISEGSKKNQLKQAMKGHIIAEGTLMGKYNKKHK